MGAQSRGWRLMAVVGSVLTLGLVLWSAVLLAAVGSPWQFGANPSHTDAAIRAEAIGNLGLLGWWLSFAFLNFLGNRREI